MQFLDQLKLGWEVLSKLEGELRSRAGEPAASSFIPAQRSSTPWVISPPTLQEMIAEIGSFPPYSAIIGACEDRAHLFLDLADPRPGSILVIGDQQSGKTHLLQAMLASAGKLNPPRYVRYGIITPEMSEMIYFTNQPHCYRAMLPDADGVADLILELADVVEQRRSYPPTGAAFILAIDDLERLVEVLNDDLLDQFRWLVQSGPEVRVWTVATLKADCFSTIGEAVIEAFSTRLIGHVASQETSDLFVPESTARPAELQKGQQFGIVFADEWIPFWIPVIEAPRKTVSARIVRPLEVTHERRNALVR